MLVTYRSRLAELPTECREALAEVSYQIGMTPSARKQRCIDALKRFDIPFREIGTGTNRFIIKYGGEFVIKIALDREGVADNKQEYVMSNALAPHVAPAHDISKGGHLLVASYAPAFTSYSEFAMYRSMIIDILSKWSSQYLLGDVGITAKNYANWGLMHDRPVCIDYAYIFPVSMNIFRCICGYKEMSFTDTTFTTYRCSNPNCKMTYTDRELRSKITQDERLKLFTNTSADSILMTQPTQDIEVKDELIVQKDYDTNAINGSGYDGIFLDGGGYL